MSIFPAFAEQAVQESTSASATKDSDKTWLKNSSFHFIARSPSRSDNITLGKFGTDSDSILEGETSKSASTSRKRKKSLKKKTRKKGRGDEISVVSTTTIEENEFFEVNPKGNRELLMVSTISRPSAPQYHATLHLNASHKYIYSKKKYKRYHQHIPEKLINKTEDELVLTKHNLDTVKFAERDDHYSGFKHEEELSQKTAFYNRHLTNFPADIKVWLEYIQFQDTVYEFEKTYRKGSIAKAQIVLAQRKLAIIDKAVSLNSSCDLLHRKRLNIAVTAFPADELQNYLKELVNKDKSNIILWQGYIEATQCSMSHCNTPAVLNLYSKCLSTLHQLRRSTSVEKYLLEESILRMLYQCCLFLKQAGLFEQLWTLLKMYLELNLSSNDKSKFNISSGFRENQLTELEDIIFTSNLPLHELWLRTERLRESCHWVPYTEEDNNCEDPQRIVFTEDVAELIHPITKPENIFKLTATIFTLLKIPLLPCRHTTMQDLGLDYVPWSLDSIEPLLSMFLPIYPVEMENEHLWTDNRLAVGPQYLKKLPGQEEYLEFILKIMENSSDCLSGDNKIAITVWFFRFQRLLIILDKSTLLILADSFKKKIKKTVREFLKHDENRQNEIYYLEYALIEYELGNKDNCFKIINTALSFNKQTEFVTENWPNNQKNWCYLYKNLIQMKLCSKLCDDYTRSERNEDALKLICEMVLIQKDIQPNENILNKVEAKLDSISAEIIETKVSNLPTLQHFLPDFATDWLIIHVLFKYSMETKYGGFFKLLDDVLYTAIENYPNNVFILSILEREQSIGNALGPRWWKMQNMLLSSGRALSSLFAIVIVNQHILNLRETVCDTITGDKYDINSSLKNKMLSLFKKVTSGVTTRKCGLVWRLYLQFVYTYFSPELCRNVYYSAVEECPWLKSLYIDAAIYIPAELSQIQDLIIEKQLRLHVTPEELDILRS
ncbi:unnamed protein product [Phaedon cochleariae]|uniref:Protein NRDE2 homolog n=1 Tax=Phaedon cochleariae TaxID=80249 RepID=A0A9N9SD31_PHACE|nr:unnamed protein product [Phaedon cochleariae]